MSAMRPISLLAGLAVIGLAGGCGRSGGRAGARAAPEADRTLATERTLGPVSVRLEVEPKKPTLSDEIRLTVTIRAEEGVKVEPPAIRPVIGAFVVRDFRHELPDIEDGREVRRSRYVLEALRSGPHLIRPLTVKFKVPGPGREGAGEKEHVLRTEPLKVEVGSILGRERPDLAKLKGPRGLVDLAPPGAAVPWPWIGGGAAVLAAAVAAVVLRRRRRPAAPFVRTPEELAYLELQALVQADLVAAERFADFYVELTGIVRRYIERTTHVHAPEQTTEEFLREMRGRKLFGPEKQRGLARFLEAADLVKFAARIPGTGDIERSFNTAKAFVGLATTAEKAA